MRNDWIPERALEPPEPKVIGRCCYCRDDICLGDDIVKFDGEMYHMSCFDDSAVMLLMERYGARKTVAEEEDGYDG